METQTNIIDFSHCTRVVRDANQPLEFRKENLSNLEAGQVQENVRIPTGWLLMTDSNKTKVKFLFCREIQKRLHRNDPDYLDWKYWASQGWLDASRPWKWKR